MKITKQQLKQIIKEELEVVLTDPEAKELFGDHVFEGGPGGHYLGSGNPRVGRYDPEDPSNTPEAIAKDEATTAMMDGLRAHLRGRGDLAPEAIGHIVLDIEEAIVAGLEGVHIPAPEVSADTESGDPGFELGLPPDDPMGDSPGALRLRALGASTRGGGGRS